MINKKRLIGLVQKLIQIDSQNPPGDETKIAHFIYDYLKNLGIKPKIYEFYPKRANVLLKIKGMTSKEVLLSPHLDTVPAGRDWKISAFSGKVKDNKIYGLGATDCKGNLGVCLEVITSLREDKVRLPYTLVFAGTADEETGSQKGLVPLLKRRILNPAIALILDAEDFNLIVCQKGLIHLKVKLKGKRAHGAYPWRGRNAIQNAVEILKELKEFPLPYPSHRLLKPPTINIGTIHGGDKVNIVADWCEFELDIR
ncbi:MAG: M20/M25/M40 family metallo-hydrolase, partial [Candidatus Omnitrophica bacterium]|nr:M20/M25/M40 family metallo-hydrolase [Candidatus Omnitrophota bacterium]